MRRVSSFDRLAVSSRSYNSCRREVVVARYKNGFVTPVVAKARFLILLTGVITGNGDVGGVVGACDAVEDLVEIKNSRLEERKILVATIIYLIDGLVGTLNGGTDRFHCVMVLMWLSLTKVAVKWWISEKM